MRGFVEYLASCLLLVALISAMCALFLAGPAMRSVIVSGVVALGVQLVAFLVARAYRARNLLLGWGIGSAMRVVALVLYAIAVAKLSRASVTPALLTFAAFLFVTTVVEPVFLKR